jgi:hypothetical protein
MDGIAVIVNPKNTVENLTKDQVMGIYTGQYKTWAGFEQIAGVGSRRRGGMGKKCRRAEKGK